MTEKRPGPAPGVRLIEVSVKRELTVHIMSKELTLLSSTYLTLKMVIITLNEN